MADHERELTRTLAKTDCYKRLVNKYEDENMLKKSPLYRVRLLVKNISTGATATHEGEFPAKNKWVALSKALESVRQEHKDKTLVIIEWEMEKIINKKEK